MIREVTPQECIEELLKVHQDNPEKFITRNFFRSNSSLKESDWNCHFGTFQEFKRQAGLDLNRNVHKIEREIAKHVSTDCYRKLDDERQNWGEAYLKPSGQRYETIIVGSDVHDIKACPFWTAVFLDTIKRVQPQKVIINGDLFDLPEFGKYVVDPRTWDVVGRIQWCHEFFEAIREAAPDAELWLIEGNHEYRLVRHLADATPALRAVLADLHKMTVADLLGLTKYGINYVAKGTLAAFTKGDVKEEVKRNWKVFYDFIVAHHFGEGRQMGLPGFHGHHHSHAVWDVFSPLHQTSEWHQLGAGRIRDATFTDGERWSNGFLIGHIDSQEKRVQFEYVDTTHNHVVVGGQWYVRR